MLGGNFERPRGRAASQTEFGSKGIWFQKHAWRETDQRLIKLTTRT
jgi:hypothetical protein